MEAEIADIVKEHGWFAASVSDADPPFLYSIGVMESCHHPELIIFGLDSRISRNILSTMFEQIRGGSSFAEAGTYAGVLPGENRIGIRRVDPTQHPLYLGYAMGYCTFRGRIGELEAVQVFWPDDNGKFPFDVACNIDVYQRQPRIDIPLTGSERKEFERRWGIEP